jgi:hypothetical protein
MTQELTSFFEEISRSVELKEEYDRLKIAKEQAEEDAIFSMQKRKGVIAEKKQVESISVSINPRMLSSACSDVVQIRVSRSNNKRKRRKNSKQKSKNVTKKLRNSISGNYTTSSIKSNATKVIYTFPYIQIRLRKIMKRICCLLLLIERNHISEARGDRPAG